MEAVQRNETFLVTKEGFRAIGLKWEGTFAEAEAGGIRAVHAELQDRLGEIPRAVPTLTYAKCEHRKGQSIDASYRNIYAWIESKGYEVHEGELTHFEEYPMSQNPYSDDPEFVIMIPVGRKREDS